MKWSGQAVSVASIIVGSVCGTIYSCIYRFDSFQQIVTILLFIIMFSILSIERHLHERQEKP